MSMMQGAAIGLDIGGGSTKVGLISSTGDLLASRRVVLAEGADFPAILAQYRAAIADLGADGLPVGIAYPGHVDRVPPPWRRRGITPTPGCSWSRWAPGSACR
jgi:glucokinase